MSEDESQFVIVDDDEAAAVPIEPEEEFKIDRLRIDYYTALRRGAIRSRTWWFAAGCMGLVFVLDMVIQAAVQFFRYDALLLPGVRLGAGVPMVWIAIYAFGRARDFGREIEKSALPEPSEPPDFSTLGNGEERWKELENVR